MCSRRFRRFTLLAVLLIALSGCRADSDSFNERFTLLSTGTARARVIEILGQPDSQSYIELFGARAERLAWRVGFVRGRIYVCDFVLERLVTKSVID